MNCAETRQEIPLEIYTYICTLLFDLASEREALATLLSLLSTSRYVRIAASEPAIWKPYYDARYKNYVREREAQRREMHGGDYRLLYFTRREIDRRGLRLLDDIRIQVQDRGMRAQELVKEFSFDVWDALGDEMRLPVPPYFREPGEEEEAPAVPHALSRKYWAEVAQGVIARSWAVKMWKAALQGDESVSFEDVMAGFSAFFGWSPMEISMRLDTECEICRRALKVNGVLLDPEHPAFSVYDVCTAIICYMKEERWVKPADYNPGSEHYFLQFFPHGILVAGSRDAPFGVLANTWLFVSLCSRLGLDTYPSHIPPNELVCCVRSTPAGNPIVIAFHPLGEPRVLQGSDLEPHGEGSLSSAESTSYPPRPESSAFCYDEVMTGLTGDFARYVQNVAMPWPHDRTEDLTRVAYIVQCAIAVHHRGTTSSMDALVFSFHFIHGMNEWFPLDCPTVISQGLYAGNEEGPLESTLRRNEDLATAVVRRSRSLRSEAVFPHFVGEIIARVGGTQESGCVIGWREGTASVRDEGAVGFSNTLSIRVLGTRAIETVTWPPRLESRTLSKADARNLYRSWKHFGRHFEDVSIEGMREGQEGEMLPTRLVLTAEIQARYPDDVLLYSST